MIFLRRTNDSGNINLLGHTYLVSRNWLHRLVRADVDFDEQCIRFYTLRRRDPTDQPLINEVSYKDPRRNFHE